jgi:hypothetical protein
VANQCETLSVVSTMIQVLLISMSNDISLQRKQDSYWNFSAQEGDPQRLSVML